MDIDGHFSIKGQKTIDIRQQYVDGSAPDNLTADYVRAESLKLDVLGQAAGVTVDIDIEQTSQQLSNETKQKIYVVHPNASLVFGEFSSAFVKKELVDFQETIDGTRCEVTFSPHKSTFIVSTPKGVKRREIIQGNDSQGPFVLVAPPVVVDTQIVNVDGQLQQKDEDYKIDYTLGEIRFLKTMIRADQEISITYESSDPKLQNQVLGMKYQYQSGPSMNHEIIYLQKTAVQDMAASNSSAETMLLVYAQEMAIQDALINGEIGFSSYKPSQSNQGMLFGPAGAVKGALKTDQWQTNAYATKLTGGFTPISAHRYSAGDLAYGVDMAYIGSSTFRIKSLFDVQHVMQNQVPIQDQKGELKYTVPLFGMPWSSQYANRYYVQNPSDATKGTKYIKESIESDLQSELFSGQLRGGVKAEKKQDLFSEPDSFEDIGANAGYSIEAFSIASLAAEGGVSRRAIQSGSSIFEKRYKLSSATKQFAKSSLSGFYESLEVTNKPTQTILGFQAQSNTFKQLSVRAKANVESTKETFNQNQVNLQKIDGQLNIKLKPIPKTTLKITYKPKWRQVNPSLEKVYEKYDHQYQLSFPILKSRWSYILKNQRTFRLQMTYYPNYLIHQDRRENEVHIMRCRMPVTKTLQLNTQFEHANELTDTLATTSNASYTSNRKNTDIGEIELIQRLNNMDIGLGYKHTRTDIINPSSNLTIEDKGSIWAKSIINPQLTLTPKIAVIQKQEPLEVYTSLQPELTILWLIRQNMRFSITISQLTEFKSSQIEVRQDVVSSFKTDLSKYLLVSLDLNYIRHFDPNYQSLTVSTKGSLVFD